MFFTAGKHAERNTFRDRKKDLLPILEVGDSSKELDSIKIPCFM